MQHYVAMFLFWHKKRCSCFFACLKKKKKQKSQPPPTNPITWQQSFLPVLNVFCPHCLHIFSACFSLPSAPQQSLSSSIQQALDPVLTDWRPLTALRFHGPEQPEPEGLKFWAGTGRCGSWSNGDGVFINHVHTKIYQWQRSRSDLTYGSLILHEVDSRCESW